MEIGQKDNERGKKKKEEKKGYSFSIVPVKYSQDSCHNRKIYLAYIWQM